MRGSHFLHLIGRLGFRLDERSLRRAGLDYWHAVTVRRHASMEEFEATLAGSRLICFSAHARTAYTRLAYRVYGAAALPDKPLRSGRPPSVASRGRLVHRSPTFLIGKIRAGAVLEHP